MGGDRHEKCQYDFHNRRKTRNLKQRCYSKIKIDEREDKTMITDSFDNQSAAKINPQIREDAPKFDACILTFSYMIEKFVLENYSCKQIGQIYFATGVTPIYQIDYNNKKFAFYKTYVGAPACVGTIEDTLSEIKTNKYIVFGGCGCLDKEITHGKVIIPTEAYRDEGTSYHYAPPSDYIQVKNASIVAKFMKKIESPMQWAKHGQQIPFTEKRKRTLQNEKQMVVYQ